MLKYVDCEISYPVTLKQVIACFAKEGDNDVLKVYIPKHSTNTFALPIHWTVCSSDSAVLLSMESGGKGHA